MIRYAWIGKTDVRFPSRYSDAAFATETRAYLHLQSVCGIVIPRFFGSYTIGVPVPEGSSSRLRPVRIMLYEYIPSIALADIDVNDYSTSQRQAIMAAVLDAHSILNQMDVIHPDIHPRNVIIVSANKGERAEIRLIDFADAWSGQRAERDGHIPTQELEPRADIVEHWRDKDSRDSIRDFAWLIDWPWNEWLENEYGKDRS